MQCVLTPSPPLIKLLPGILNFPSWTFMVCSAWIHKINTKSFAKWFKLYNKLWIFWLCLETKWKMGRICAQSFSFQWPFFQSSTSTDSEKYCAENVYIPFQLTWFWYWAKSTVWQHGVNRTNTSIETVSTSTVSFQLLKAKLKLYYSFLFNPVKSIWYYCDVGRCTHLDVPVLVSLSKFKCKPHFPKIDLKTFWRWGQGENCSSRT